jgi:chitin disaccharide deacetylase
LIVHADDFGETVEITRGICAAIEGGAVTSTSIMANMPGTADALLRVASLAERASFGVHLNLCEGVPLTPGRTLVNAAGRFHRKRELFMRSITGLLSVRELEAEISAQIAMIHDAGIRISHIDGHKHLHQLPTISTAVSRVLPRFGITRIRITRLGGLRRILRPGTLVREGLAWHASAVFRRAQLCSPDRVLDIQAIMRKEDLAQATALLRDAGVVEVFCHPGTALADIEKPGSCQRHTELEYLLSPRFKEILQRSGARKISYWDI